MAEEPNKPDTPDDDVVDDDADDVTQGGSTDDLSAMKKALEKANREAKKWRLRVQDMEDAGKSDLQKAQDMAATAQAEAAKANARADRLQVALDKGLTATQAKRLVGDSVEELEADADDLLADFKPSDDGKKPPSDGKPKPNLQSGNDPDTDDDDVDADALAEKIMGSRF